MTNAPTYYNGLKLSYELNIFWSCCDEQCEGDWSDEDGRAVSTRPIGHGRTRAEAFENYKEQMEEME